MDRFKKIFTKNLSPRQKQYEALRMVAVEGKTFHEAAEKFGYSPQTLRNLKQMALTKKIEFFPDPAAQPRCPKTSDDKIEKVIELRKQGHSMYDIFSVLKKEKADVPLSTIGLILSQSGMAKLNRRTDAERGVTVKNTLISDRSMALDFAKLRPFKIDCPVAGLYLFLPYILEGGIIDVIKKCALPKSADLNSVHAAMSMLLLKLMGNERLSHIRSYDQEPGLGIAAGLNVLPKPSYMCSYSCRTNEKMLEKLQREVIQNFKKQYPGLYGGDIINLDFHSIPHFGEESQMEKVWCGARGKSLKGASTILAQDAKNDVILYTRSDFLRKNETQEIKKFVDYWIEVNGKLNETLVFDCKLTSYKVLGEIDERPSPVKFITLRKRNKKLLEETAAIADDQWERTYLPIPKRKNTRFLVHECQVQLPGCKRKLRQIIIKDHGRVRPTFIITNNFDLDVKQVLTVYAKRWHIENKINELVSFFNLNALSSPLMIRIHFDIFWTVIADTLYRRFAMDLPRFEKARAGTLFKRFINFPGRIEFDGKSFAVKIRKRGHTPLILGIEKLNTPINVPWLNNLPLKIEWTA